MVIRMKFDINKGIFTDFGRNILNGCRDNFDELSLVDLSMNLPMCQIQELYFYILVLIRL